MKKKNKKNVPLEGPIRNMKVEEMKYEDGKTYITYSFSSLRPLDSIHITLHKPINVTWEEFKSSIIPLLEAMENQEDEISEFDCIELSAVEDTSLILQDKSLSLEAVEVEMEEEMYLDICPVCGKKIDDEEDH